jgi:hypothetical protein
MNKITEYKTVVADSFKELDLLVNKAISQGFQPYGSPYLSGDKVEVFTVAQAMVK